MRAGGQFRPRLERVSTWTDDDAARPIDVAAGALAAQPRARSERPEHGRPGPGRWSGRTVQRLGMAIGLVVLLAGCSSAGGSPTPSGRAAAPYALRATQHQSIPPESQFTWLPYALITADGVVVTQGPVPAIFPGPLLPNLQGAPISEAGYDRSSSVPARSDCSMVTVDFTPPEPMPGSLSGLIELRVDGTMRADHRRPEPDHRVHHDPVRSGAGHRRRRSARSGASSGTCARWSATSLERTPRITPRAMRC